MDSPRDHCLALYSISGLRCATALAFAVTAPPGSFPIGSIGATKPVVRTRSQAPARLTHRRETLEVPKGGARLVLVADTHSAPHTDSAKHIAAERPSHILHAGDIGDLAVLDDLAKLAKVTAVRGNIDVHARGLA